MSGNFLPSAGEGIGKLHAPFCYEAAFDRNIGWITVGELQTLRRKTVAIAGMGGVGGAHLLTLARMGIGGFKIADFDRFDIVNFNRQVGATTATLGKPKVEIMAGMVREINPESSVQIFPDGVTPDNLESFLQDVDLFVDGFDFFALDIRAKTFARCAERGIPAVTAAPIGLSTGYLIFIPGGMTFEEYFRLEGLTENRRYINFFLGLVPAALQRSYLVDASRLDLAKHKGPSSPAGVQLCAGVVAAEALKLLLGRGPVRPAPHYHQFDAFTGRWVSRRLPGGNDNYLQRRKLAFAYRAFRAAPYSVDSTNDADNFDTDPQIVKILDYARWAPSGDNVQPWRFSVISDKNVRLTVLPKSTTNNVYEYDGGQPTLISIGGLLESLRIAATAHGRKIGYDIEHGTPDTLDLMLTFDPAHGVQADPLREFIPLRSVDRRPFRTRHLSQETKRTLAAAAGDLSVTFYDTWRDRYNCAKLCAMATDIRLRIPETFEIHKAIIDWQNDFSAWGIPAKAINLDIVTRTIMKWAMRDWQRVNRLNRSPTGTAIAQLEMDLIPGIRSGAFMTLVSPRDRSVGSTKSRIQRYLDAGASFLRIWLTATKLGLVMQPTFAPLCFSHYIRAGKKFTTDQHMQMKAERLTQHLNSILYDADHIVCMARIGYPAKKSDFGPRSIRLPLKRLVAG